ncbi:unnamed protein product [Chrysodeixis includens]|uniref:Uncharacterized protein n=1 Tax=Chrysodeixis includens TaxID=689277 RepID=A0A9P0C7D4_CHRIL|nr:unnamed protein product [Chrysodeixis includens]
MIKDSGWSVILVYEYNVNSDSNVTKKISLKPNWLGSKNDSDIKSFDSKFTKKINFDRTTLKLLPILLKALNKNRYLEKVLEDYSSSSPPYIGKDSTETTFKRNVFSDSKNWLKMPSSKHYTVDYKTSPLVYWKSPTKRLDYLTKIRKIRDYQRMLNYFDKMINEKVGNNQKRDYGYTESTLMAATVPMKVEKKKEIPKPKNVPREVTISTHHNDKEIKKDDIDVSISSCKCPKKIGMLLNKLITGIQNMLPGIIINRQGGNTCGNKTETEIHEEELTTLRAEPRVEERVYVNEYPTTLAIGLVKKTGHRINKILTTSPSKIMYVTKKRMILNHPHQTTTVQPPTSTTESTPKTTTYSSTEPRTERTTTTTETSRTGLIAPDYEVPSQIKIITETATTTERSFLANRYFDEKLIQLPIHVNNPYGNNVPYYFNFERNTLDYDSIVRPTDKPYIETTRNSLPKPTTEMFVPIKFIDTSNEEISTEKALKLLTILPPRSRVTLPLYREEEYDDYFLTTEKTTQNDLENINSNSLELIKTKMMSSSSNEKKLKNNFNNLALRAKQFDFHPVHKQKDMNSMRKMAKLMYIPKEMNSKSSPKMIVNPTLPVNFSPRPHKTTTETSNAFINHYTETTASTDTVKTSPVDKATIKMTEIVPESKTEAVEPKLTLDQGNVDALMEEEFQDDYLKQSELKIRPAYKYKHSGTVKVNTTSPLSETQQEETTVLDVSKNEEKPASKAPESMLPSMRPLYLEIQRHNDWRQDDHPDYDINFNNNIFDLPNI